MLEDTEAKVTGLSAKIEQLQQKLVLAEKNYAEKSADCRRLNQKVADIEVKNLKIFLCPKLQEFPEKKSSFQPSIKI